MLVAVAEYLLENESMDGADFNYFCDHGEFPPKKEVDTVPEPMTGPGAEPEPGFGPEGDSPEDEQKDDELPDDELPEDDLPGETIPEEELPENTPEDEKTDE